MQGSSEPKFRVTALGMLISFLINIKEESSDEEAQMVKMTIRARMSSMT